MKMSNSNSPTLLAQQIHFIHEERARLKEMVLGDVRLRFLEKEILPVLDEMLTSRQLELAQEGFTEGFEGSSPGSTSTPDGKFRHEAIKKSDSLPPMASSLDREDRCSQEFETTPGEDPPTHPRRSITPPRGSLADSLCARSHREVFSDMIERVFSG
eukprot:726357_1